MPHRRRQHDQSTLPRHGRVLAAVVGVALALSLLAGDATRAADTCTTSWDGDAGTDRWTDAANWTGNRLPGAADRVCIGAGFQVSLALADAQVAGVDVAGSL